MKHTKDEVRETTLKILDSLESKGIESNLLVAVTMTYMGLVSSVYLSKEELEKVYEMARDTRDYIDAREYFRAQAMKGEPS